MAYDVEIELLSRFADDLWRLLRLEANPSSLTEDGKAEIPKLRESLHRRTAAMRRAVERSGVNFRTEVRNGFGQREPKPVDVLEAWHNHYVAYTTHQVLLRAIGAYESGTVPESPASDHDVEPITRVRRIVEKLPRAARALRGRYDKRETLKMDDEYDVQDLLRALLVIDFDDVRKEEWTPSHAGKCSRMDLFLKPEQIVIEAKITKPGRAEKQIGDELIVDIERYQAHPDCKRLVCFVYDPTFQIGNPAALEQDLSREDPIKVQVIVAPKH